MFVYQFNCYSSDEVDVSLTTHYYSNLKKAYGEYKILVQAADTGKVLSYARVAGVIKKEGRYFSSFTFLLSVSITKLQVL